MNQKLIDLLSNPATTFWSLDAIRTSLDRDPVDALRDAEDLVEILRERCEL